MTKPVDRSPIQEALDAIDRVRREHRDNYIAPEPVTNIRDLTLGCVFGCCGTENDIEASN